MRGGDEICGNLFSYIDLEDRVREDHPLRPIRGIANAALASLSRDFAALYSGLGRPSVPPEKLLRAMLLQAFYSVRSERQLMERIEFDLLFRWFVGLGIDDPVWDHSSFTKNRDRLLEGEIAAKFLAAVLSQPRVNRLLSSEHFSVDGTLIQAWASMKSFRPKAPPGRDDGGDGGGRNAPADFRGQKRSNDTHQSTTDPDARLYRKGPGMEARLCFIGHGLMENRSGLLVDARLTRVSGHAERLAALDMVQHVADRPRAVTLGADRGYDAADFVEELRSLHVRPHVAQNVSGRRSAIDRRTTRHPGYAKSQRIRKRIEEAFGWIKGVAGLRQTKLRGLAKVDCAFHCCGNRLQSGAAAQADRDGNMTRRAPSFARAFAGRWQITEMDEWDEIDLLGSAHITFTGKDGGELVFIAIEAALDVRYGTRHGGACAEFSWEGFDDGSPASGRGWAALGTAGRLVGHIFIHKGDDSAFVAER